MSLTVSVKEIVNASASPLLAAHSSWKRVEVAEVATILNGAAFKSSLFNKEKGWPLIRIRDVGRDETQCRYTGEFEERYVIKPGDLLVGMDGDFRAARWRGPKALLNQRVCKITPTTDLYDPRFLDLVLPGYLDAIRELTSSVTVTHLSSRDIAEIPLPLPPLAEQTRIAAKLDEVLARVNAARERLAKVPTILRRFRQAVLAAACSGRLTADVRDESSDSGGATVGDGPVPIPSAWRWCRMQELIGSIRSGSTAVPQLDRTPFPILRSSSVRPREVDLSDVKYVDEEDSQNEQNFLKDGDLLFTRLSGSVEYVANCAMVRGLEGQRIQYPDRLFRVRLKDPRHAPYVEHVFNAPYIRKIIAELAKSSAGHQRISQSGVTEQWIPVPPPQEEDEIVRRVNAMLLLADKIEKKLSSTTGKAEKMVQAVLAKAFRGELVPTEAELTELEGRDFETAEQLLERIRAARVASTSTPQTRRRPSPERKPIEPSRPFSEELFETTATETTKTSGAIPTASDGPTRSKGEPGWVYMEYDEAMSFVREAFAEGGVRDREQAIKDVATALGFKRVGSRVRADIDGYIKAAVRRGILNNADGLYSLLGRSAADYSRDHLIDMLLASVNGAWILRDDAIRATAKHLGFSKAGTAFKDALKSAINGALRRKLIEAEGDMIRKV